MLQSLIVCGHADEVWDGTRCRAGANVLWFDWSLFCFQATGNWSGSASTCEGVYIQKLITGDVTWCCLTLTTCYQLVLMMDFSTGCHGSCFGWLLLLALA